jgi:hypothetical protein
VIKFKNEGEARRADKFRGYLSKKKLERTCNKAVKEGAINSMNRDCGIGAGVGL